MKKHSAHLLRLLLCLILLCVGFSSCRGAEPPSPDQLATWGIRGTLPRGATLSHFDETEAALCLFYENAAEEDLHTLVAFLQGEAFTELNGKPAEVKRSASGKYLSFMAEKTQDGRTLRASAAYFIEDGAFDGEKFSAGQLFLKIAEQKTSSPVTLPAEEPTATDYTLPDNVAVEFSFSGERVFSVKLGEEYYCERYGTSYFYRKTGEVFTEYILENGSYVSGRTVETRFAVEYLVFGLMLDAGEFDLASMGEGEPVTHLGRAMLRYVDAHEGIVETVLYDPVSKLIFAASTTIEGMGEDINEVVSFDETVTDFGTLPTPQ